MKDFTPEEWLEAVDRGIREGAREALERHRLAGQSIHIWRDGRIVEIPPGEIAQFTALPGAPPAKSSPTSE